MKFVRATGKPDLERVPQFYHVLANSSYVTEARLFDLNIPPNGNPTGLYEVDGNLDHVETELSRSKGIQTVETAPITDNQFNLLVTFDTSTVPLLHELFEAITQEGLIVTKPIIYRDGQVHVRIVGSSAALQTAISKLPSEIELEINAIGEFDRSQETPISNLSNRQQEAVVTAFALGYYDHPRESSHEEIATHLGCAPNTLSDHLQKAEGKIMAEVLASKFEKD